MKILKAIVIAAAFVAPATVVATQAQAQVAGVAVADPEAAVAGSKAWAAARAQIETTYKAQLDQAEARRQAIAKELQPLYQSFETARRAPGATEAALRPQATTLKSREDAANLELQRLTQPAQRAQQYAIEQISAKLSDAVQGAVRAKNVTLLLRPNAALFAQPAADITSAVTAELDRLVPSIGTTPPANWQPGQQGQAAAAGAAPAAAGAAPRAATPRASSGR